MELTSIGLPDGVCLSYPVNSLNCTFPRSFPPDSFWPPPMTFYRQNLLIEKNIFKNSLLSSSLPSLHTSTPLSLPVSFVLFFFLCLPPSPCIFPSERICIGQAAPKSAIFLFVLPQSILITGVHQHNTTLFLTLSIKLKLSS